MLQLIEKWWAQWRARQSRFHEFDACSSFDLDRIAQDLNMSVFELREATANGDPELLVARLRESGIDPSSIELSVLRDLQRCCGNCSSKVLCAHEVEDKPIEAKWPAYCPNRATIDALMMKCH
jgi:hypothetical protein